ncbi:MAG: hypothetical protein B6D39_02800 [Anaerolineae bacterium UTCFX2]|jgi:signal-transduction protein with cAMP-binding, CBS, and nucleotidyltransferase domain|nr:CBS domain-containing protein [Anaerolineales bacterium]OQY93490.1 MAG: hypothetical protein B6D39_02800 [Anaerolineae bacterium UTCFX2]
MAIEQTVLEAKRYGVVSCDPQASLLLAAQRMVEEDISALVVVGSDGSLQGLISRTDLMRALIDDQNWQNRSVAEYMNPDVVTVSEDASIQEVANILLDRQIHRVVVVKKYPEQNLPISVVSAADIVYHMTRKS